MEQWFPVVTLLVGVGSGALLEYLRFRWTRSGEADRLARLREQEIQDRRDAYQRETLEAAQEAADRVARGAVRVHLADLTAYRQSGGTIAWGKLLMGDDVAEEMRLASMELSKRRVRVKDDELRNLLTQFGAMAAAVSTAKSEQESDGSLREAINLAEAAHERTGVLLREVH